MTAKSRAGFTLLELVVALAITSVALAAGYAALGSLVDRRQALDADVREVTRIAALRSHLTELLAGSSIDEAGTQSFRGVASLRDGVEDDAITFLTRAHTPLGDGPSIVRLFIARDAAGRPQGLAAEYAAWHGTAHSAALLDSTVRGLSVQYRASVVSDGEWQRTWLQPARLPVGVRVRLIAAAGDSLPPLARVPMVIATEAAR